MLALRVGGDYWVSHVCFPCFSLFHIKGNELIRSLSLDFQNDRIPGFQFVSTHVRRCVVLT
jgi:hypothetical protein